MLNLWVCDDDENQVEEQPRPDYYPPPQKMGKRCEEPYATNMVPRQTAGSIYDNESNSTEDARLQQVPAVSTNGSVLDNRSCDYDLVSAGGRLSKRRSFYKWVQQRQHQQEQHEQSCTTAPAAANKFDENSSHYQHTISDYASSIYSQCQQYQPVNKGNQCDTCDHCDNKNSNSVHSQYHQQTYATPVTSRHYSYNDHEATHSHVHYGNGSSYGYNQHEPKPQSQSHYGSYANVDTERTKPASQYASNYDLGPSSISIESTAEKELVLASPNKEDSTTYPTQFQDQYQTLCLFSKTYGHTNVPKVRNWFLLGSWVENLRKRKKFQMLKERGITVASPSSRHPYCPLSDHELGLLEDIGFNWNAPSDEENDEILAKMKEIDNSIVEQVSSCTHKVIKKTPSAKVGEPVSHEVSAKDNEGSEGEMRADQMWNAQYKKLAEFKRIHGHCAVPARSPDDPKLGNWVMTQRRQYNLMQKGKENRMTKERFEMLEQLGFQWAIRTNPKEMWNKRLQELVEYKRTHGNCLVPQRYHLNPQLGTWVNTQRRHYKLLCDGKKSCMTEERLQKLNEVDFVWSRTSSSGVATVPIEVEEVEEDDITPEDLRLLYNTLKE